MEDHVDLLSTALQRQLLCCAVALIAVVLYYESRKRELKKYVGSTFPNVVNLLSKRMFPVRKLKTLEMHASPPTDAEASGIFTTTGGKPKTFFFPRKMSTPQL
jgi:hypothetical protein